MLDGLTYLAPHPWGVQGDQTIFSGKARDFQASTKYNTSIDCENVASRTLPVTSERTCSEESEEKTETFVDTRDRMQCHPPSFTT
jgi:hypothetical protein